MNDCVNYRAVIDIFTLTCCLLAVISASFDSICILLFHLKLITTPDFAAYLATTLIAIYFTQQLPNRST